MTKPLYTLQPAAVAELDALPTPPVLLYALDGHIDSGLAAGLMISDLVLNCETKRIATFDTDDLVDYRSRRPPMIWGEGGWSDYGRPELIIDQLRDVEGTPYLLLYGPEPDFKWEAFAQSVVDIVEQLNIRMALGLQGLPKLVPHTRPALVRRPGEIDDVDSAGQGVKARLHAPGSAMAMIEYRLRQANREATTLAADVPTYLAAVPYARAAVSLVNAASAATGLKLATDRLEEMALRSGRQLEEEMAGAGDLTRTVMELEQRFDRLQASKRHPAGGGDPVRADSRTSEIGPIDPRGASVELIRDLERFLAEQPAATPQVEPEPEPGS
ncbi:MAG: PAC2 family protein [Micrococcales bacterium]|nr:PAC2 family protein [Micrococcales bacterium]